MPSKPSARSSTPGGTTKPSGRDTKAAAGRQHQKPAQQKRPLTNADRLKRLFTSLCAQIDGGHFANAVKTCDKILRIDPQDLDAIQTKLFLLLQTEQYASALVLIDGLSEKSSARGEAAFDFEKAYSLYRLHREDESTAVLDSIKQREKEEENRGVTHLEAQLAYRQGEYQSAFDLYNTLLDTAEPHSDEQADILTNLSAAQAHLDFLTSGFLTALSALPPALAESLESAPPPIAPSSALPSTSTVSPPQTQPREQEKKPRARRLPKGVVPGVTPLPDPERWLKKSERASFMQAHARRRGRGGGGGATQGVVETPGAVSGGGGGGAKGKKKGKK